MGEFAVNGDAVEGCKQESKFTVIWLSSSAPTLDDQRQRLGRGLPFRAVLHATMWKVPGWAIYPTRSPFPAGAAATAEGKR